MSKRQPSFFDQNSIAPLPAYSFETPSQAMQTIDNVRAAVATPSYNNQPENAMPSQSYFVAPAPSPATARSAAVATTAPKPSGSAMLIGLLVIGLMLK